MLFNSYLFIFIFLPIVLIVWFSLNKINNILNKSTSIFNKHHTARKHNKISIIVFSILVG